MKIDYFENPSNRNLDDLKKWVTTLDSVEDAFKAGMLKMLDSVGKYIPKDVKKGLL